MCVHSLAHDTVQVMYGSSVMGSLYNACPVQFSYINTFFLFQNASGNSNANITHFFHRVCFKSNFPCSSSYANVRIHIVRTDTEMIILESVLPSHIFILKMSVF
jgi:hypothetical protein